MVRRVAVDAESARERPLFSVGEDVYRWEDVMAFARVRGDWDELAEDVRIGLAALHELESRGEAPGEAEIDAAAREFRYGRRLLAGDELVEWLDRRGVAYAEWSAYLERSLAREQLSGAASPETDVEPYLWPEGICSGRLDELAVTLAGLVAVAPGIPLEDLDDACAVFRREAVSEELIAREIETNRLEWLRFSYEMADFEDEDAAREGALCVRNDGDSLTAVAARAGVPLEERVDWLEATEPELASQFLAARLGDLVGPVLVEEGFRLAVLRDKLAPSLEDEAVRSRGAAAVVERTVERAVADRVTWLEPW
jgi:hypothetical protein